MKTPARRKTQAERRLEIAHAVLELIGRRGASSLTAASIAQAVEVTPGALFRHFKTTDEMLEAAVELAIEQARACFPASDLPPLQRLEELLCARIATIRKQPGLAWLLLSEQAFLTIPPPAVTRLRALVKDSRRFLTEALQEAIDAGSLRDDIPLPTMLVILTGVVHSLSSASGAHGTRRRAKNSPPPSQEVLRVLLQLLGAEHTTK